MVNDWSKAIAEHAQRRAEDDAFQFLIDENARLREQSERLKTAMKPLVSAIRFWLSEDECECEMFHHCGKAQREREVSEAEALLGETPR